MDTPRAESCKWCMSNYGGVESRGIEPFHVQIHGVGMASLLAIGHSSGLARRKGTTRITRGFIEELLREHREDQHCLGWHWGHCTTMNLGVLIGFLALLNHNS